MSFDSAMRNMSKRVHLALSKKLGATGTLSHRSGAPFTIYLRYHDRRTGIEQELGLVTNGLRRFTVEIAIDQNANFVQSTGESEPVEPGDEIVFDNKTYEVETVDATRRRAVYRVGLALKKAFAVGN